MEIDSQTPSRWRSCASRTCSIASSGETVAGTDSWSRTDSCGIRRHDTLGIQMTAGPKLTIVAPNSSAEEAAAVVAALERFMSTSSQARTEHEPETSEWLAAALSEGVARQPDATPRWG